MKARHCIPIGLLLLSTAVLFVGCGFLDTGTTIDGRIQRFVTSVNDDMAATYQNLVPGSAAANASKDATFWETWFPPADGPYTHLITSETDTTDVRVTITGDASGLSNDYSFVMADTGSLVEEWYISDILVYDSVNATWTSLFGT
jgi:hypothetical protein